MFPGIDIVPGEPTQVFWLDLIPPKVASQRGYPELGSLHGLLERLDGSHQPVAFLELADIIIGHPVSWTWEHFQGMNFFASFDEIRNSFKLCNEQKSGDTKHII